MKVKRFGKLTVFLLVALLMAALLFGCKKEEKPAPTTAPAPTTTVAPTDATTEEPSEDESSEGGGGGGNGGGNGGGGGGSQGSGGQQQTTQAKTTAATTAKSTSYYPPQVIGTSAPGTATETFSDGTVIDYSNSADGYIMIKYSGAHSNVRVQIATPEGPTPTYPIFSTGWETLPLTNGNGTYNIKVLANDGGNQYAVAGSLALPVSLSYSTAAFYRPNIFCNYNAGTPCVGYAAELTRGCDTEVAKIEAIYNYVVGNFKYDYGKASSVSTSAYIPNLNSVWASKSGICFDYASTMAAMLRTQGLPTRVCVGNVNGGTYHAWISVYVKGSGWVNGIIQFDGNSWKLMDPTFASTGGNKYDWSQKGSYAAMYYY
ncbi:MAG: transglutaminase domain-containing protein [Clostridia bacterium]|nr:transglutaminase domain-containing protein [Clostridia bacterium]MBQ2092498.1 transglutaminase domain-containing protein [Clostridia bacterium]MBQ2500672.1 transglutaminase domain-containing protein [Clostridia bacterium]MBQ3897808.1 transglutaminase domain-containing protein [Clostridia bacterium]